MAICACRDHSSVTRRAISFATFSFLFTTLELQGHSSKRLGIHFAHVEPRDMQQGEVTRLVFYVHVATRLSHYFSSLSLPTPSPSFFQDRNHKKRSPRKPTSTSFSIKSFIVYASVMLYSHQEKPCYGKQKERLMLHTVLLSPKPHKATMKEQLFTISAPAFRNNM